MRHDKETTKKCRQTAGLIFKRQCQQREYPGQEVDHLHVVIDDFNLENYFIRSAAARIKEMEDGEYKKLDTAIVNNLLTMRVKQRLKTIVTAELMEKMRQGLEMMILYGTSDPGGTIYRDWKARSGDGQKRA